MTERPSTVPPFTVAGITFRCLIAPDGPNELGLAGTRYVWRSDCGRYAAGRIGRNCWARVDGALVGADFPTIGKAMHAAVHGTKEQAA